MHPRSADSERGVALPPWLIGVSIGVVVMAMLAFVITGGPDRGDEAAANPTNESTSTSAPVDEQPSEPVASTPSKESKSPSSEPEPAKKSHKKPDRTARDRSAYVEVYNNSGITGLANETAAELQDAGWKVVGADNWYGDIPDSTVYYPSRLHDVAKLLAADLGIKRLHTAVAPMRFDRLTVILTGTL
ncbi:MAG TPA: LytR C-terminal domain-containing protein [Nocardioidaceae bacterium]|nr:LytR C-terminal domain-containing protein [Nocardioidaceae bacterium]